RPRSVAAQTNNQRLSDKNEVAHSRNLSGRKRPAATDRPRSNAAPSRSIETFVIENRCCQASRRNRAHSNGHWPRPPLATGQPKAGIRIVHDEKRPNRAQIQRRPLSLSARRCAFSRESPD